MLLRVTGLAMGLVVSFLSIATWLTPPLGLSLCDWPQPCSCGPNMGKCVPNPDLPPYTP